MQLSYPPVRHELMTNVLLRQFLATFDMQTCCFYSCGLGLLNLKLAVDWLVGLEPESKSNSYKNNAQGEHASMAL